MRYLIILLSAVLIFSCSESEDTANTSDFLLHKTYVGTDTPDIPAQYTYYYDSNNNPISLQYNNSLNTTATYTYDNSGQLIEIIESPISTNDLTTDLGSITYTFTYLNETEFIAFYQKFDSYDILIASFNIKCNFEGKLIKSIKEFYTDENDPFYCQEYYHDDQGKLTKLEDCDNLDTTLERTTVTSWEDNSSPNTFIRSIVRYDGFLRYFPTHYISTKHPKELIYEAIQSNGFVMSSRLYTVFYEYDNSGNVSDFYKYYEGSISSGYDINYHYEYIPAN